jgi:polyhydroxybutyrate depolymerase
MRALLPLLLLAACGAAVDTDLPVEDPDPRFDRTTWPTELGGERPAAVVAPELWDGRSELALIVVLHGYGANGAVQDMYFGVSPAVDRGFIAIIPDGTVDAGGRRFWNATDACCDFLPTGVDDVGYLLGLVDAAIASFPVDPARVSFVGHSNGGFMAHRLACEAPARLDAIISLAGASFDDPAACPGLAAAGRAPRVLQIHGTNDTTIAYAGGDLRGGARYPSAADSAGRWAARAGCGARADVGTGDLDNAVGGPETTFARWDGCADGRAVGLWTMQGSAHIPTVNQAFKDAVVGWLLGD